MSSSLGESRSPNGWAICRMLKSSSNMIRIFLDDITVIVQFVKEGGQVTLLVEFKWIKWENCGF